MRGMRGKLKEQALNPLESADVYGRVAMLVISSDWTAPECS